MSITETEMNQNRELIGSIYSRYKNYMFSLAGKYASDPGDCDDIVQDSVMRLLQNASVLKRLDDCRTVTYLNLTVRSAALDFFDRKKSREKYFEDEPYERAVVINGIGDLENTVEETILKSERNRAVNRAMQRLPERFRLLLMGKYYLCLSDEELTAFRGCQRQSLRTLMNRAKRMMQKELEKEGITDEQM